MLDAGPGGETVPAFRGSIGDVKLPMYGIQQQQQLQLQVEQNQPLVSDNMAATILAQMPKTTTNTVTKLRSLTIAMEAEETKQLRSSTPDPIVSVTPKGVGHQSTRDKVKDDNEGQAMIANDAMSETSSQQERNMRHQKAEMLRKKLEEEEKEKNEKVTLVSLMKKQLNQMLTEAMIGYRRVEIPELRQMRDDVRESQEARDEITHGKYLPGSIGTAKKALQTTPDLPGVRYEYRFNLEEEKINTDQKKAVAINELSPNQDPHLAPSLELPPHPNVTIRNHKRGSKTHKKSTSGGKKVSESMKELTGQAKELRKQMKSRYKSIVASRRDEKMKLIDDLSTKRQTERNYDSHRHSSWTPQDFPMSQKSTMNEKLIGGEKNAKNEADDEEVKVTEKSPETRQMDTNPNLISSFAQGVYESNTIKFEPILGKTTKVNESLEKITEHLKSENNLDSQINKQSRADFSPTKLTDLARTSLHERSHDPHQEFVDQPLDEIKVDDVQPSGVPVSENHILLSKRSAPKMSDMNLETQLQQVERSVIEEEKRQKDIEDQILNQYGDESPIKQAHKKEDKPPSIHEPPLPPTAAPTPEVQDIALKQQQSKEAGELRQETMPISEDPSERVGSTGKSKKGGPSRKSSAGGCAQQ